MPTRSPIGEQFGKPEFWPTGSLDGYGDPPEIVEGAQVPFILARFDAEPDAAAADEGAIWRAQGRGREPDGLGEELTARTRSRRDMADVGWRAGMAQGPALSLQPASRMHGRRRSDVPGNSLTVAAIRSV